MVAGQLVFPVIVGVAILMVSGYVFTTPATPAPEVPTGPVVRVEPGDTLILEITGYYDAPGGNVYFSTQEERHDELPRGVFEPQLQENTVRYTVADVAPADARGLDKEFIGRRSGENFTTGVIAAEFDFGTWTEKTLTRDAGRIPGRVEFNSRTQIGTGRSFNINEYTAYFRSQGYNLTVGLVWPCEDPPADQGEVAKLWECRLVTYDLPGNSLSYDRIIEDGDSYPIDAVVGIDLRGDEAWDFTLHPQADGNYTIRLDPPVGATFQFPQDLREPYRHGTYTVLEKSDDTIRYRYSTSLRDPFLIGRNSQYDVQILRVLRG